MSQPSNQTAANQTGAFPENGARWSLPRLPGAQRAYDKVPDVWEVIGYHSSETGHQAVCKAQPFDPDKLYTFAMLPVEILTFQFKIDLSADIDWEDLMDQFRDEYPHYDTLAFDGASQHVAGAVVVDEKRIVMGCSRDGWEPDNVRAAFAEAMEDALGHAEEESPSPSWKTLLASMQLIAEVHEKGGADVDWVEIGGVAWLTEPIDAFAQPAPKEVPSD